VQEGAPAAIAAPSSQPSVALRTVPCDTLERILAAHGSGRPIAFLKIDAEGAELAIIRATDWRAVRPTVLLIEATKPRSNLLDNQAWEPILLEQGYLRAYFDGINCFYVPEECADLLRHFEIPVNVLDGFHHYNAALVTAQEQARDAQHELARMSAENVRYFEQEAVLKQQLHTAQSQLQAVQQRLDTVFGEQNTVYAALERGYVERLDHVRRDAEDKATRLADLRALLDQAAQRETLMLREAGRLHRLVRELRFPDGPSALRVVLPFARMLRRLMGTSVPAMLPEEATLAALTSPAAGLAGGAPFPPAAAIAAPAPPRRSLKRRVMRVATAPVRRLSRPIAWRTRTFMIATLEGRMAQIDHQLRLIMQHIDLAGARDVGILQRDIQAIGKVPGADTGNLEAELKQFGRMLESTLLTLALDEPGPRR
jgi:hypothetical protein